MKNIIMVAVLPVLDRAQCSVVSCGNEKELCPVDSFGYFPSDFFEEIFGTYGLISEDAFIVAATLRSFLLGNGIKCQVQNTPGSYILQFETPDHVAVSE